MTYSLLPFAVTAFSILNSFWFFFFFFGNYISWKVLLLHSVFSFLWSQKLLPSNLGLNLLQESFFILNFYMVTTLKCRIFLIIFLSKSIYVLDFTSTGFTLIVVWCALLYLLSISANLSLYTCTMSLCQYHYFLIWK